MELPEEFKFGKASGRDRCEISRNELNDRFVGVAPFVKPGTLEGLTTNDSKNALLRVRFFLN